MDVDFVEKFQIITTLRKICLYHHTLYIDRVEGSLLSPNHHFLWKALYFKHKDAAQNINQFNPGHMTFLSHCTASAFSCRAKRPRLCIKAVAFTDMESCTCSPSWRHWKNVPFLTLPYPLLCSFLLMSSFSTLLSNLLIYLFITAQ